MAFSFQVDSGCITNLFPTLYKDDWDVLIAHFLGVVSYPYSSSFGPFGLPTVFAYSLSFTHTHILHPELMYIVLYKSHDTGSCRAYIWRGLCPNDRKVGAIQWSHRGT